MHYLFSTAINRIVPSENVAVNAPAAEVYVELRLEKCELFLYAAHILAAYVYLKGRE